LKELAFAASHGPRGVGINHKVLSDIMWSLWKTLSTAIRTGVDRDLTNDELELIAKQITITEEPFVRMWIQTVRNTRLGKTKEGVLVKKWAQEKLEEQLRLSTIKTKGVDAKYEYKPYNPSNIKANSYRKQELKDLKKVLEMKLSAIFS